MNPSKLPSATLDTSSDSIEVRPLTEAEHTEVLRHLQALSPGQAALVLQIIKAIIAKDYYELDKLMSGLSVACQDILGKLIQAETEVQA